MNKECLKRIGETSVDEMMKRPKRGVAFILTD